MQEAVHSLTLLIKGGVCYCHLLIDNLARDLFNIDVTLGQLLRQLTAQIIALAQHSLLSLLSGLTAIKHRVLMAHQLLQVLRGEQHKVILVRVHLLAADAILAGDQVKKLISLLA